MLCPSQRLKLTIYPISSKLVEQFRDERQQNKQTFALILLVGSAMREKPKGIVRSSIVSSNI